MADSLASTERFFQELTESLITDYAKFCISATIPTETERVRELKTCTMETCTLLGILQNSSNSHPLGTFHHSTTTAPLNPTPTG